jgi:hypothetical protein
MLHEQRHPLGSGGRRQRTKVIFIAGMGRSGSTVLGEELGAAAGVIALGEVRLAIGAQGGSRVCSCGQPLRNCSFWGPVRARYHATENYLAEPDLGAARISEYIAHAGSEAWMKRKSARGLSAAEALYEAAAEQSESAILVDSSKHPTAAWIALSASNIDAIVVHLVRDPRAVAYSDSRSFHARGREHVGFLPPRRSAVSSALRWQSVDVACRLVRRHKPSARWLTVRYEDFAAHPNQVVSQILAGHGIEQPIFDRSVGVEKFHEPHHAAGNPVRFATGKRTIAADDRWIHDPDQRRAIRLATLAAATGIRRYGYPSHWRSDSRRSESPLSSPNGPASTGTRSAND